MHELLDEQPTGARSGPGAHRRHRRIAIALVLAGVALHLPSLGLGFIWDDYIHQVIIRDGGQTLEIPLWNLYDFIPQQREGTLLFQSGILPWWTDDDMQGRFFRPVTSASILLDHWLYGDHAAGYHVTSLLLYAIYLTLSFRLFRALGVPRVASLWGLAFLAFEDVVVLPVQWIANRNTLLASLFVVATLRAVIRYRTSGRRRYLPLAALYFLLACGSKESGIVAFPLVALYLLLLDSPAPSESIRSAARRVARSPTFWIFLVLAGGYLSTYVAAGYGANSLFYLTPWKDTPAFLVQLAVMLPIALLSLLFGFPSDIMPFYPHLIGYLVAAAVPILAFAVYHVLRLTDRSRLACFALGWIVLSVLPSACVLMSDRLYMTASFGSALLLGLFMSRLPRPRIMLAKRQYACAVLSVLFLIAGIIGSAPIALVRAKTISDLATRDSQAILTAEIDSHAPAPRQVVLLNTPTVLIPITMWPTWCYHFDDSDIAIFAIQFAQRGLIWERTDERRMRLTSAGRPFRDHPWESLFATTRETLPVGKTFRTAAFTATVIEAEPDGIRTVELAFERSLDDPSVMFLAWRDDRFARVAPPRPGDTRRMDPIESWFP